MPDEKIGIICKGRRGEAIAFFFARRRFQVYIYELDRERANEYIDGSRKSIEIKDLKGKKILRPIDSSRMKWVERLEDLKKSDYVIEATEADIETRREYLKKVEGFLSPQVPIISHDFLHVPGDLAAALKDSSRFLAAYFWDIDYTGNSVELVAHPLTSMQILDRVEGFFKKAGLLCDHLKECVGYIHNRVGLLGIQNLFRMYDQKILSYDNLSKYFVYNRHEPYFMTLELQKEIRTELYHLLPLFKKMNKHYGPRFYLPAFLKQDFTKESLEETIRQSSVAYPVDEKDIPQDPQRAAGVNGEIENIFVSGIQLIHNNLIFPLIKYKKIYFDSPQAPYFSLLEKYHPRLYQQVMEKAVFIEGDSSVTVDLIIDFSIQKYDEKVARVKSLQDRFGDDVPLLLNSPIYKIEDIARDAPGPRMIFGMYTQKNYLKNTEIILTPSTDREIYLALRAFLKQIAGDCIETGDAPVRPLYLMIASKWLESVRVLEEGLADIEAIEFLGVDRKVFDDIDMFGLNNLITTCEYLKDHYPDVCALPGIVMEMEKENKLGYATGTGFLNH